ncbi:MAG TPA: ABC transporter substrate-binding protein [Chloroflexota bacterium]|nr:ABC transporter substrate-binding protein [Chloroflexota bacterium]
MGAALALALAACGGGAAPASPAAPSSTAAAPASAAKPAASAAPASAPASAAAKPAASASGSAASGAPAASGSAAAKPGGPAISTGHLGSIADIATFVALDRGYFSQAGANVQLELFKTSADEIPALASGQLLIGAGGVNAGLFNAVSQGIPLSITADQNYDPASFTGTGWFVREDLADTIKDPKDLKGHVVGLGSTGSVIDTELDALLKQGGLTTGDITIKNLSYADQPAAMANKSLDVTYAFQPFSTVMVNQKTARLWKTSGQIIPNHEATVVLYSPDVVQKNPDGAKAWMVGYLRGVRDVVSGYTKNNNVLPDDLIDIMVKYSAVKDPNQLKTQKLPGMNPDGYPNKDSLKTDLDYFTRAGFVKKAPDLDKVVDQTYVDYAISKIGKYQAT